MPSDDRTADDLVDVTITADDPEWLAGFTRRLVEEGLAACGNIVPGVRSIYRWNGEIEEATEALVVLHTRRANVAAIIERTSEEHPYETPHVLAHPVSDAHPGYRDWLLASTGFPYRG